MEGEASPHVQQQCQGVQDRLKVKRQHDSPKKERRWLARAKEADLLHWKDMPKHLQFNPYIFTGYRPMLSVWGCLNSLFYLHNETINILTHGNLLPSPKIDHFSQNDKRKHNFLKLQAFETI